MSRRKAWKHTEYRTAKYEISQGANKKFYVSIVQLFYEINAEKRWFRPLKLTCEERTYRFTFRDPEGYERYGRDRDLTFDTIEGAREFVKDHMARRNKEKIVVEEIVPACKTEVA